MHPWKCFNCDLNLDVYNASNDVVYKLNARCCQNGVMYGGFPFQQCQTVDFPIKTGSGLQVGYMQKKTAGVCASAVSNADNFALTFPVNATVEDKALLLAATLFADYQWFERRLGCTF